jgi:hypothetical protein
MARRLAFGVWRLAFGVRRSAFGVRRSPAHRWRSLRVDKGEAFNDFSRTRDLTAYEPS